jgi:hypothetical protein
LVVTAFAGLLSGCSQVNDQIAERSMTNLEQQTEPSDAAIREMFIESGLGEGDSLYEEVKKLPKDRVIAVVRAVRNVGIKQGDQNFGLEFADERLKMKAAYYLCVSDVDYPANENFLLEFSKSANLELKWEALGHIAALAGNGRKEYLPMLFASVKGADGHFSEGLVYFFFDEAENSTEQFLRHLSRESPASRAAVLKLIAGGREIIGAETVVDARARVSDFQKDGELAKTAGEFLAKVTPLK